VNYNATAFAPQYDEASDPNSNRSLTLAEVPVVTVSGTKYREFFLDVNQLNNSPFLSLNGLTVSVAGSGQLRQSLPNANPFQYDPTFGGQATQAFDLGANALRVISTNNNADFPSFTATDNGSGRGDVRVLIPDTLFATAAGGYASPHVYLFSRFGYSAPADLGGPVANKGAAINEIFYTNDGFEEWSVKAPEFVPVPKITVVKYTTYNGTEVDNQSIPEGSAIGWKYIATNSGNVPLTGLTVVDNVPGVNPVYQSGDANSNSILDVGESWVYTASGTAQSAHLGTYTNLGTATATYENTTVTATDPSWYHPTNKLPGITIVKSASVPGGGGEFGGDVTFTYTITSQSDPTDPLTLTSLMDDNGTPADFSDDVDLLAGYYTGGDTDNDANWTRPRRGRSRSPATWR
jgi:hypothetical protein